MNVTCKICKNKIQKEEAFVITKNNKNSYYCSKEEYEKIQRQKQIRVDIFKAIEEVIGTDKLSANGSIILNQHIKEYQETVKDLSIFYWTVIACDSLIKQKLKDEVIICKDIKLRYALGVIKRSYKLGYTRMAQENLSRANNTMENENVQLKKTVKSTNNISHLIGE